MIYLIPLTADWTKKEPTAEHNIYISTLLLYLHNDLVE
jgi:hypothetical protein